MVAINKISAHEFALKDIFSKDFDFNIPPYQRPYAWTWENACDLFDDVVGFCNDQGQQENYFLGSLVLIKKESSPLSTVIDGQQRLTTLTILLAIISWKLKGFHEKQVGQDWKRWEQASKEFAEFINEQGNSIRGLLPKPRLTLRLQDNEFLKHYVQGLKFEDIRKQLRAVDNLTESKKNIVKNSIGFIDKLESDKDEKGLGDDPQRIYDLGCFLANHCYLVAVSTSDQQSAFRIFSVLNTRGLDLKLSDILKAEILEKIPENQLKLYTEKWEREENNLGRDPFSELFAHIRMIEKKAKAHESVLQELRKANLFREPSKFIDNFLIPYAEAFHTIKNAKYESTQDATKINETIKWLNRIENSDWVPPAILFLQKHTDDDASVQRFFELLERLAASMYIRGIYRNHRIDRYGKLIAAIEKEDIAPLFKGDSPLLLNSEEIDKTLNKINGEVYKDISIRQLTYLLLRLDSFIGDQHIDYDKISNTTIEHVLPQTIPNNSTWPVNWSEDDRDLWLHKLGNLVLLSNVKNPEARNYDFKEKKAIYFGNKDLKKKVTLFGITVNAMNGLDEWTPEVVEKRQKELIEILKKNWDLQ